jgi:hypothetical protein
MNEIHPLPQRYVLRNREDEVLAIPHCAGGRDEICCPVSERLRYCNMLSVYDASFDQKSTVRL